MRPRFIKQFASPNSPWHSPSNAHAYRLLIVKELGLSARRFDRFRCSKPDCECTSLSLQPSIRISSKSPTPHAALNLTCQRSAQPLTLACIREAQAHNHGLTRLSGTTRNNELFGEQNERRALVGGAGFEPATSTV